MLAHLLLPSELEEKLLAAAASAAGQPNSVLYCIRLLLDYELDWYWPTVSKEDPLGILSKVQCKNYRGSQVCSTSSLIELHAQAGYGLCSFSCVRMGV
jgi:hypothetical protein